MVEGSNMSWENIDMTHEQRIFEELLMHDPTGHVVKEMCMFNTNSILNIFVSLIKPFLRPEIQRVIVMGCVLEHQGYY